MRPTPPELAQLRQQAAHNHHTNQHNPTLITQLVEAEQTHTANHTPDTDSERREAA